MPRLRSALMLLSLSPLGAATSGQEWRVDTVRAPGSAVEFTATRGTWMNVDVAPDGRTILFDLLGQVYEVPIGGGEARALTSGHSWNMQPRYSPDGQRIVFTSDRSGMNAIWAMSRDGGAVEPLSRGTAWLAGPSWTADGRGVYATAMDLGARYSAQRLDKWGSQLEFVRPATFTPPTHFTEHPSGKVYFSVAGGNVYGAGFQIRTYDLKTGESATVVARPGGAMSPAISRSGRWLAYAHRDDRRTQLILHDLTTGTERVLSSALDRDRQEAGAGTGYGAYPAFAFTPDDLEVVIAWGGELHAVHTRTGAVRDIRFAAPVRRQVAQRLAFPVDVPDAGMARTRSHRFGIPASGGVIYEALGDLHLLANGRRTNLTSSSEHESSPAVDAGRALLFYATWSDDSLGAVWVRPVAGGPARKVSTVPTQYGSLALSPDGQLVALRGTDDLGRGNTTLEEQQTFEMVLFNSAGGERVVTRVSAIGTTHGGIVGQPPGVSFAADGQRIYYTEFAGDSLVLRRIRRDGEGKELLYVFPHAVTAQVSPDERWIVFREYHRTFITPFAFAGRPVTVSAHDKQGASLRVDSSDGAYAGWSHDGTRLYWTRGTGFYEKALDDVVAGRGAPTRTELSFEYAVAVPSTTIALTNARVLVMDSARRVWPRATVLIRNNRIEAVGPGVRVPADARVFNLAGKTVMPGMIDAHAHYNPALSMLHTVEQRHNGLLANLAYGTTTLYEVYGNVHKDFLVSDLQRAGMVVGSRLFSTGNPIYGLRTYRPKLFRPIQSFADAQEIVRFNKDHGATALKDYVQFGRAARQQLYEAARALGVNVVAETAVDPAMNFTMLLDGVSGLEHTIGLTPLFDDVTRLWRASGAGNTPTLIVSYNGPQGETTFRQSERLWDDPKVLQFFRRDQLLAGRRPTHYFDDDVYAVEMAAELRKLHAAGISLQGSGHGQQHGLDKHWELELFVKGGFAPMDALAFATIQSAQYLGLARQLGSIEPGKLADLVILDGNPLDDIRHSRRIDLVMLNGVLYAGKDAARVFPDPQPARRMYFARD